MMCTVKNDRMLNKASTCRNQTIVYNDRARLDEGVSIQVTTNGGDESDNDEYAQRLGNETI